MRRGSGPLVLGRCALPSPNACAGGTGIFAPEKSPQLGSMAAVDERAEGAFTTRRPSARRHSVGGRHPVGRNSSASARVPLPAPFRPARAPRCGPFLVFEPSPAGGRPPVRRFLRAGGVPGSRQTFRRPRFGRFLSTRSGCARGAPRFPIGKPPEDARRSPQPDPGRRFLPTTRAPRGLSDLLTRPPHIPPRPVPQRKDA